MKPISECRLYAFVDTAYLAGREPATIAHQLCDGGADIIQLRAKGVAMDEVRRLAALLLPITNAAQIPLVINDYPALAKELGAWGCHLGQEDFFEGGFTATSEVTGGRDNLGLGLSTHAPDQAERAVEVGPNYVAVGPIYPTATKVGRPGVTLDYVRWAAEHITIPWFAIGGITLENLEPVLAAGARRIAVVSAILKSPDVVQACQRFRNCLLSTPLP